MEWQRHCKANLEKVHTQFFVFGSPRESDSFFFLLKLSSQSMHQGFRVPSNMVLQTFFFSILIIVLLVQPRRIPVIFMDSIRGSAAIPGGA